jgi:hypothetical protein
VKGVWEVRRYSFIAIVSGVGGAGGGKRPAKRLCPVTELFAAYMNAPVISDFLSNAKVAPTVYWFWTTPGVMMLIVTSCGRTGLSAPSGRRVSAAGEASRLSETLRSLQN